MAAPLTGQVTSSATATPVSASPLNPTTWFLKALASNTAPVYVGGPAVTTTGGYAMEPGDTLTFDRRPAAGAVFDLTPDQLFVVGSGGVVTWVAFR